MKFTSILSICFVVFIKEVCGSACPRTNKRSNSKCVDECLPSIGCADKNKQCLCDGDCGFSCVKKSLRCTQLKKFRNGRIIGKNTNFNATLKFVCNPNFQLFGASIRRCRAKGLWDGKKSRCKIACSDPGIPSNTRRNRRKQSLQGFSERTKLRYDCAPGYTTTDKTTITCLKNGRWTSSPPVCRIQQCSRVVLPSNSQVRIPRRWKNKASHQLGTRLLLSCKPGHRSPVAIGLMRCVSVGWRLQTNRFMCIAKSCGDPGSPRNGRKSGLSYSFKDVVHYSCDSCYELSGASYRQCLSDGSWSDQLPQCTRKTCADPGDLRHGIRQLSSQPIYCGSFVEYTCDIGYKLDGNLRQTCLSNGKWSGSKPTCNIINCGDPGQPKNGNTVAADGYTYGNDVRFSCNDNYVLEGSVVATCEINEKWSRNLPFCLERCSDPSGKTNAIVTGSKFYHGKTVMFTCRKTHMLVPGKNKRLTCENGEWRGIIPTCKAMCRHVPKLSNGYVHMRSREHGSIVRFRCKNSHQLIGNERFSCNDGRWSSAMPKCLAICPTIRSLQNGWVFGERYLDGDLLSFRCRPGYVLDGESSIRCTKTRQWNANKPICRAPCSKQRAPLHGRVTRDGFKHQEQISFECNGDYHLEGRNVLTCFDGAWNDNPPKCLAPCLPFNNPPFLGGSLQRAGFRHGELTIFSCRDPLVVDGEDTLRCNNGRWNHPTPRCAGPCTKLAAPENGFIFKNGFKHGETITFRCRPGYQIVGIDRRKCNFGEWSDSTMPRCELQCPDPSRTTSAHVRGNEFYEGKRVEFVCRENEIMEPSVSKQLTCAGGAWNGVIPLCKVRCPDPSRTTNAQIVGNQFYDGKQVEFVCRSNEYLHPSVSKRLTCTGGAWNGVIPSCKAPCLPFNNPPFLGGSLQRAGFRHGELTIFSCRDPLVVDGEDTLRCNNGRWNHPTPRCAGPCTKLAAPENGFIFKNGFKHGETITFRCRPGYQIVGIDRRKCNFGEWSDSTMPRCELQCPDPSRTTSAHVRGNEFYEGKRVEFVCRENEIMEPSISKRLTCTGGAWNGVIPSCKAPCLPFNNPPFLGGSLQRAGFRHGDLTIFSCRDPLVVDGEDTLRCNNGRWNHPTPRCAGPCTKLAAPENGFIFKNGFKHGETITFRCRPGYQIVGIDRRKCNFGEWSDSTMPRCELRCPDPSGTTNAQIVGNQFYDGKQVEFVCRSNEYLHPSVSKRLTCTGGAWNGVIPSCKVKTTTERISTTTTPTPIKTTLFTTERMTTKGLLKTCPEVKLRKGKVFGRGVTPGSKRSFECWKNWVLEGEEVIKCLASGQWNATIPKCVPTGPRVSCPVIGKIKGGYATLNESHHGGRVTFRCLKNYKMEGKRIILCRSGKWSRSPPKCLATCMDLGAPPNGLIKYKSGHYQDDLIIFGCHPGYVIQGQKYLQCNEGKWSNAVPTCVKKSQT
ncbi:sushi, von Willebrand factor type A, EGF and pentraxin domain-containing protein 1-like isoform X2 [Xenia sp. Carnegie-2017]|uniref:sushi, von Willebrand factor type A, EGF and pentraxin domain-containing protein 1-like isoform X1 n=1 Tax=Xenia sp. Carnegie-2017 TaxID=2897299 RepID=UPI001F040F2B|nr:sushi, von Willebrand factor type A, EGF and pentraxin domain-containing protein 1-like isoform X1 [Xenia sp. Carnegie-2017]XP_046845737.1 sushi, von Willebrand factor type A, EGF and pentraxin domain-containing protein 1-like isoform X2 [Xenia sp. Carnegie-2017]